MKDYEIQKAHLPQKSTCPSSDPRMRAPQGEVVAPVLGHPELLSCPQLGAEGRRRSEQEGPHAANLALLLDEDLEVLVDDGDGKQDPSARTDGAQEVGQDRQGSNAQATEGRRCGDVPIELMDHGCLSVAPHHHLLLFQLLSDILG